jgi:hypothetical protein
MDPVSGTIVATLWEELGVIIVDSNINSNSNSNNPLATPILLTLQGVSCLERAAAMARRRTNSPKGAIPMYGIRFVCQLQTERVGIHGVCPCAASSAGICQQ